MESHRTCFTRTPGWLTGRTQSASPCWSPTTRSWWILRAGSSIWRASPVVQASKKPITAFALWCRSFPGCHGGIWCISYWSSFPMYLWCSLEPFNWNWWTPPSSARLACCWPCCYRFVLRMVWRDDKSSWRGFLLPEFAKGSFFSRLVNPPFGEFWGI